MLVFIKNIFCPCHSSKQHNDFVSGRKYFKVEKVGHLPAVVNEASGMEYFSKDSLLFHINDSGGQPEIYSTDSEGNLKDTLKIPAASNRDWEDLSLDPQEKILYIGDLGNNRNQRKDLKIYRYDFQQKTTDTIGVYYEDQTAFPPDAEQMNFDGEGFFPYGDSLYIFSKNRGDRWVKWYSVPDSAGSHKALVIRKIWIKEQITSADVSPDGSSFLLLSYGKIYVFRLDQGSISGAKPMYCIRFPRSGQSESVCYLSPDRFMVSNESGKLYLFSTKKR